MGVVTSVGDVQWSQLGTANGGAVHVPSWLGGLRDARRAQACLEALGNALFHRGGFVCEAASVALPFLVDLASDPRVTVRPGILTLVASMAAEARLLPPQWVDPSWPTAWSDALDDLLILLADPAADVRIASATAVAQTPAPADRVATVLRGRFEAETSRAVRANVVRLLGDMHREGLLGAPQGVTAWLAGRTHDPDPCVALFATLAHTPAGDGAPVTGPRTLAQLVRAVDPRVLGLADPALASWNGILEWVTGRLGHAPRARREVNVALLRDADPQLRLGAVTQLSSLLVRSRADEAETAAVLGEHLHDPEPSVRGLCAHLCVALGEVARAAVPTLSEDLVALLRDSREAGHRHGTPISAIAAWGLARAGDERCVPYLQTCLRRGGRPFGFASTYVPEGVYPVELPGMHEVLEILPQHAALLLPAVRAQLHRRCPSRKARAHAEVLAAWGAASAPACPELVAMLSGDVARWAARALGAIGEPAHGAQRALARAVRRSPDLWVRLEAAAAHSRVSADPDLALQVLPVALADRRTAADAARHLAELGPVAVSQAARLRDLGEDPDPSVRVEAAHALWRITGEDVHAVLLEVLQESLGARRVAAVALPAMRHLVAVGVPPEARAVFRGILESDRRMAPHGGWRAIAVDAELRRGAALLGAGSDPGP